jgi:hypothetical protein
MAHRFVSETQGGIEPMVTITHQGIVQGTALDQARGQQLIDLLTKAEGTGRGDRFDKEAWGEFEAEELAPDGRLGVVHGGGHLQGLGGLGQDKTRTLMEQQGILRQIGNLANAAVTQA